MINGHHILTGQINSGKSTRLWTLFNQYSQEGVRLAGFISLPVFEDKKKIGYDLAIIKDSRETARYPLARNRTFGGAKKWRDFWFDESIFAQVEGFDFGQCDIFLIDEIGPLELVDKKGFYTAAKRIYETFENTITVVRSDCPEKFYETFGIKGDKILC